MKTTRFSVNDKVVIVNTNRELTFFDLDKSCIVSDISSDFGNVYRLEQGSVSGWWGESKLAPFCDVVDPVNHPAHYQHPSGIEAIDICEHHNFNVGNALKYCIRAGLKGDLIEDLKKAAWYINREIDRLEKQGEEQKQSEQPNKDAR